MYLINWYMEVRGNGPLTFTEIKNWSELTSKNLKAWEVETLMALDRINWKVADE